MDYKLVISDRSFNVIEEIQDIASDISWSYNRIGGCGGFAFEVPIRYCEETFLGGNFNVKIYRKNPVDKEYDLWYQGRIENKSHGVQGVEEKIKITGNGYQSQLKDIYVSKTYSSSEASVIVKNVLDTFIVPNTNISYSAGDISSTSFTFDTLDANKDGLDVMQTISDVIGSREWGVDKDRNFFFKARSSSIGFRFPLDSKVLKWTNDTSSNEIINRVVVIGGDVAGTTFTRTVNDSSSQKKWGRRDKVVQNSSIVTNEVADQFGAAIFADLNDISRRASLEVLDEQLIETTIPIPLVNVVSKTVTWGTKKWGTFLYGGRIAYQINRINYKIDDLGNMIIALELGRLRPNITEDLTQLEYRIDQLANMGV
jgi:hypothetical protein